MGHDIAIFAAVTVMSSRSKRPPVQGQGSVINEAISCLHFSYQTVLLATRNFDTRSFSEGGCKLGEGGFGPVFKGELHRTEVAIKVLRRTKPVRQLTILFIIIYKFK